MPAEVNLGPGAAAPGWRQHWPLWIVLAVSAFLLFTNLDKNYLWADEGDTAVLAQNILEFGVPTAWDGVSFTDSDYGQRLTDDLVMVSSPWLQYYVTAGSFAVFGESAFAARLPFALFGLLTIGLAYALLHRIACNRWAAASAALLLMLSVQFLLYSRQSRYYSLTALLTCLLVLQFARLRTWGRTIGFAVVAALLFHSHPIGLAPVAALGLLPFVHKSFRYARPWILRAMPIVTFLTVPWLFVAVGGYVERFTPTEHLTVFVPRLLQFAIECLSVTSMGGAAVLFVVLARRVRRRTGARTLLTAEERLLAIPLVVVIAAFAAAMALTQNRETIWMAGMRYTAAILPFAAMLSGLMIAKASRGRWQPWLALILIFGFTKFGRVTPWVFWEDPVPLRDLDAAVTFHNPEHVVDRVLRTGQIEFVQGLFQQNVGTTGRVAEFLNANAKPDDVVVTNYAWEPIYFHTGLRLGMTVLPSYPIWEAAHDLDLPKYVFSAEGARWFVWRRAWGEYRGQACGLILADLRARGIPVTLVATIPETMWENRENVHFRRFPGKDYLYSWFDDLPSTLIFRVDWPKTPAGGGPLARAERQDAWPAG